MTDLFAEARALPLGPSPETRAWVVSQVGRGELEALHPELFRWASSCARGNRELALEALQSSYLFLLEEGVPGASDWRAWLFGVIRRKALALVRRERVRRLLLLDWGRVRTEGAVATPLECAERRERAERLRRELQRLSERQRGVLELVFDHGLTLEQAAHVLGVRIGTARTHYERGKRILMERMQTKERR